MTQFTDTQFLFIRLKDILPEELQTKRGKSIRCVEIVYVDMVRERECRKKFFSNNETHIQTCRELQEWNDDVTFVVKCSKPSKVFNWEWVSVVPISEEEIRKVLAK